MADMGQSRVITESQFVVVVIEQGPSMAVTKSQIEVVEEVAAAKAIALSESQSSAEFK